jgi:hypothetical protein
MKTVHRGVWTPADNAESRYRYVTVDVPPGTQRLTVCLEYDRSAGVLDLGCIGHNGQSRGWSGGARSTFTISSTWATPGYLSGPIPAGAWHVMLGLYRIPPQGLPWTVTTETSRFASGTRAAPAVRTPRRPPLRDLPAPPGHTWLPGDLHAHSVHSDGALTVVELAALAADSGLHFLAITDHNTVAHHAEIARLGDTAGPLLIPGQEVTTDRGHANAYGDVGWIDFRRPCDDWVSTVEDRGGLLSINHPIRGDCAWLQPLTARPPLAEVWHSSWRDRTSSEPLAWLLAWGPGTTPIGGSDFHRPDHPHRLGRPTTWVACAERSAEAVLAGLRAGRVAVTGSTTGPMLLRIDGDLIALEAEGALVADFTGRRRPVTSERAVLGARAGLQWLEDPQGRVLALCTGIC